MGVVTDLESLCNGVLQSADHGVRLMNKIVESDMLDSPSVEEMKNILRLFAEARASVLKFQHSMTLEQRFEEFE